MKKKVEEKSRKRKFWWVVLIGVFLVFFVLPILFSFFDGLDWGNVALIPIEGMITAGGGGFWGEEMVSSEAVVDFLKEAEEKSQIEAVVIEINSPGGSAVASDEIASQIKKMKKPVVTVIREVGASGGYWVASAGEHVIANRMSITGSIGVVGSYLEFSGLMEKYGVGYERLVAGEKKDMGAPYRKLSEEERKTLQKKLDRIQDFFIKEIAENRKLGEEKVREMATGEFFLGVEALERGLVDELGNKETAEKYLKEVVGLEEVDYVKYETKKGLLGELVGVVSEYFFRVGEGIGAGLVRENKMAWV